MLTQRILHRCVCQVTAPLLGSPHIVRDHTRLITFWACINTQQQCSQVGSVGWWRGVLQMASNVRDALQTSLQRLGKAHWRAAAAGQPCSALSRGWSGRDGRHAACAHRHSWPASRRAHQHAGRRRQRRRQRRRRWRRRRCQRDCTRSWAQPGARQRRRHAQRRRHTVAAVTADVRAAEADAQSALHNRQAALACESLRGRCAWQSGQCG